MRRDQGVDGAGARIGARRRPRRLRRRARRAARSCTIRELFDRNITVGGGMAPARTYIPRAAARGAERRDRSRARCSTWSSRSRRSPRPTPRWTSAARSRCCCGRSAELEARSLHRSRAPPKSPPPKSPGGVARVGTAVGTAVAPESAPESADVPAPPSHGQERAHQRRADDIPGHRADQRARDHAAESGTAVRGVRERALERARAGASRRGSRRGPGWPARSRAGARRCRRPC